MATAKTAPAPGKAVAKPDAKSTAIAAHDYGEDAGAGFEGQDSEHLAIPFLALLQSNSPQVTAEDSTLRAGMLFNSVTGEAYPGKTGLVFVPACIDHAFTEWVPREKGGGGGNGFRGVHKPDSEIVLAAKARPRQDEQKRSVILTEDENHLVETFYMYGVIVDADGQPNGFAVMPFASTKIKVYRNYMTKISLFNWKKAGFNARPPLYANSFQVTSKEETKGGDKFYNLVIAPAVDGDVQKSMIAPDSPVFAAARDVWQMVRSGAAKAAYETEGATQGTGSGGGGNDEEIPF